MNATRTRKPTKAGTIEQVYRHPGSFAQNGIRYFIDRAGNHVVVHDMHGGEDIMPGVRRFATVEEARVEWTRVRKLMTTNGYTQRIK